MYLLFLTPQFPFPPQKGTTLRNYNIIANLAARHEIDLLAFTDTTSAQVTPLHSLCRRIATTAIPHRATWRRAANTLTSSWPDMGLRLWSMEFKHQMEAWLSNTVYDIIQVEGLELARYGQRAKDLCPADRTLVVFDNHNAEYLLQERIAQAERQARGWTPGAIYSTLQARKLRGFERRVCRQLDRVVAVSKADAEALRQLDPTVRADVIPNGIDTSFYRRDVVKPLALAPHALVFTGTMDFRPNVDAVLWFAQEVLPLIQQTVPDVHFYVVGQRPHARLEVLRGQPAITLTGGVADTRPYVADAAVYVIPLRMGGGTRLKLLEAWAMEAPVVSTRLGAEGFEVRHERELLLVNDEAEFARAVVELLIDPDRAQALGQRGRMFAAAHYDWRDIVPHFEEVYCR
jgi:sugar transferase (PEP-CTERM/EpsH1 system associated)